MRHRIKSGKVGSFTPEKQKVEVEQQWSSLQSKAAKPSATTVQTQRNKQFAYSSLTLGCF